MEEITITIQPHSEGGYQYDIYLTADGERVAETADSYDGGICTSTMANALEMAHEQAKKIIREWNKEVVIEVSGGVVTDVLGLPEGYTYTLLDHDNEE